MASNRPRKYVVSPLYGEPWAPPCDECFFCGGPARERHHWPRAHSSGGDHFVWVCETCHTLQTGGGAVGWLLRNIVFESSEFKHRVGWAMECGDLSGDLFAFMLFPPEPNTTWQQEEMFLLNAIRLNWGSWTFAEKLVAAAKLHNVYPYEEGSGK